MRNLGHPQPAQSGAKSTTYKLNCRRLPHRKQRQSVLRAKAQRFNIETFYQDAVGPFRHRLDSSGCTLVDCPFCGDHSLIINTRTGDFECSECEKKGSSIHDFRRMLDGQEVTR